MKKITIGLILVTFIFFGAAASAESLGWVGKKVEKETVVKINDEQINAIVIDGRTFIAVRDAAETFGYDLSVNEDEVVLSEKNISIEVSKKGIPYLQFQDGENEAQIFIVEDKFQAGSSGDIVLYPENDLRLTPEKDLRLSPHTGDIYVPDWSRLIENESQKSLKEELDELREMINNLQ